MKEAQLFKIFLPIPIVPQIRDLIIAHASSPRGFEIDKKLVYYAT